MEILGVLIIGFFAINLMNKIQAIEEENKRLKNQIGDK